MCDVRMCGNAVDSRASRRIGMRMRLLIDFGAAPPKFNRSACADFNAMSGALTNKALSAAAKGDLATLKALKDQIDLNHTTDKFGATPVHYAARAGKVDCIRWLVQSAGLSGNRPANNGATPAHDAAATGQIDCLQWLVQFGGCSATSRDSCGATPLHLGKMGGARSYEKTSCLQRLLLLYIVKYLF